MPKRIGIMTGGGDCACLNAAIHGVGKALLTSGGVQLIGIEDGFYGLLENSWRPLTHNHFNGLMREAGTILGTSNKSSPFNYHGENHLNDVLRNYHQLQLDAIVALGGDGTMSLCHELSQSGINFIGIPKTIDNDLAETDMSFGFDTAVSIVAESIERLRTTARSHHRVMIVETMGRNAGWIALYGGVAGDAEVILIPEILYQLDDIVDYLQARAQVHSHTLIVIAEGALPMGGEKVVAQMIENSPDPERLGGIGHVLQEQLTHRIDAEIRTTVLGHVQRGGPPSSFDRILANNMGCYGAELILAESYHRMVCLQRGQLQSIDLAEVAKKVRRVPSSHRTLLSAQATGIHFGVNDH